MTLKEIKNRIDSIEDLIAKYSHYTDTNKKNFNEIVCYKRGLIVDLAKDYVKYKSKKDYKKSDRIREYLKNLDIGVEEDNSGFVFSEIYNGYFETYINLEFRYKNFYKLDEH